MDSIRVSEAPDPGSIPGEATMNIKLWSFNLKLFLFYKYFIEVFKAPGPGSLPDCVTQAGIPGEAT